MNLPFHSPWRANRRTSHHWQALLGIFGTACAMLLWSCAPSQETLGAPQWESGKPIPLGTPDRLGPFGVGLTSFPVGWARTEGSELPDLFAVAGRNSKKMGLYRFPRVGTSKASVPIFGHGEEIGMPMQTNVTPLCAVQQAHGAIWGFFLHEQEIVASKFDASKKAFLEDHRISLDSLPRAASALAAIPQSEGKWTFVLSVSDGRSAPPPGADSRDPDYVPYDGRGIWRGEIPRFSLWELVPGKAAREISGPEEGPIRNPGTLTHGVFGQGQEQEIVSGSWFGNISHFRNEGGEDLKLAARRYAVDEDGELLRHTMAGAYVLAYPRDDGSGADLIVGGEGSFFFYRFTGRQNTSGAPVYAKGVPLLQQDADLFAGTLAVPSIVDWDGDGVLDIVAGNSEGRILFFRNRGTDRAPAMEIGVPLQAGGREIHVQPGYKGDIQGPGEARWGYISPNVFDWNGDGLPDILASDSTARHYVYLNEGTKRAPKLGFDQTLYLDGLDLHGTWRVRPGVGKLGERLAYIALDDEDEFHLYWRIDNANLSDGGKLRMEDGAPIRPNFIHAGGTGRSKIELVDWDGGGVVDLLVGTPKHHSIPNPETGLPRALGMPGTMVLFLKNVGTNEKPVYRFPEGLKHDGQYIHLGHHEIGASAGPLGPGDGMNIVVSREDGQLLFFQRERLN